MKKEVLANFPYTDLTVVAFVIFLGLFLSVIYWLFLRKGSAKFYEEAQLSSLSEGEKL